MKTGLRNLIQRSGSLVLVLALGSAASGCLYSPYSPVAGFSPEVNAALAEFFSRHQQTPGRRVAVFDGDGTVLGQAPHYLADECMYEYAEAHPEHHPEVIRRISPQSNVSIPYVIGRVEFFSDLPLDEVRALGVDCYDRLYANRVFAPMRDLVAQLQKQGFEVWIVTASPEALYQSFLSRELGVPVTNVVGVKSIIHDGIISDRIVHPVPQDEGKREAIETFVQARPLLVGGNSRGDREMIEFSADVRLIVNPDEHVATGQEVSIADYARTHDWLIARVEDRAPADFPAISSRRFGVRENRTQEVSGAETR
ncbi:MAG: haloacid dehalogenase-like hydrolase [Spirochaetales bacterium]|nr:haloacid dehalogenase-like hydrolase [Leptospiraceae bacterium]MCP5480395.1 haloacid dehalogenase-like hydrolase [Spirochaetales bacterium]